MQIENTRTAAIVGAGPAGLMAADVLARAGVRVTLFERMPSAGRKFLLAGRGGLNITHSESWDAFLPRYREAAPHLAAAIEAFSPAELRAFCEGLGQETFVGSSGRIFPRSLKTSPLLRAWLRRLGEMGVAIRTRHRWLGWDGEGRLQFQTPDGPLAIRSDCAILALGGASWPQLGSDGAWAAAFRENGVGVAPLRPSNCGLLAGWSEHFRERFAGQPLKNVGLGFGETRIRGEAMITARGIEGGGVYALSPDLREAVEAAGEAMLAIDLAPDTAQDVLTARLSQPRGKRSLSNWLRKQARLQPVEAALLNEAALAQERPLAAMTAEALAALIKAVPVRLMGTAPIERAISTAGGVAFPELDEHFMLRARPGTFLAGEMLDWEAPTGGYLLQAVFSTGAAAGHGALRWLGQTATAEPQHV